MSSLRREKYNAMMSIETLLCRLFKIHAWRCKTRAWLGKKDRAFWLGKKVVASSLLAQLPKGVYIHGIKFQELNGEYEESEKRLGLIEQGQTAIASMNDQNTWIYIARNAHKIKADQNNKRLEDDEGLWNCCVIL